MASTVPAPSILLLIAGDPMRSHRPAEALRIGLGLDSGGKERLTILLRGPAAALLTDEVDDAVDGEELAERYLPVFQEWGTTFLVDESAAAQLADRGTDFPYKKITSAEIAAALASAGRVLIFQ